MIVIDVGNIVWYQQCICVIDVCPVLLMCVLKTFWCQIPEDGDIIAPKPVAAT